MSAPQWFTREQIGLAPPNPQRLTRRGPGTPPLRGVTIHHTASRNPRTRAESFELWRAIQRQAMSGNNPNGTRFGDLEYAGAFDPLGNILAGRDQGRYVGAHASSHNNRANETTFGYAYLGDGRQPIPAAAFNAMAVLVFVTALTLRLPGPMLLTDHAAWKAWGGISTACCGATLRNNVAILKRIYSAPM